VTCLRRSFRMGKCNCRYRGEVIVAGHFGVAFTWKAPLATYLNSSLSVPIARVRINTDRPEASVDRFGFGDLYLQPLKLGWRLPRWDFVTGYAFYAPTGKYEAGGSEGVGLGRWSHELSAGGTAYLDGARTWSLSALSSYQWNTRNRGIDLTRGSTVQVQGGLGKRLFRILELGPTGYALWQVSDDRGADLPEALRGARDRNFGLGAEVGLLVPKLRTKLNLRYCHDFGSRSRPQGQVIVLGLSVAGWMPENPG
ncbi:MAG: SphA family protein, partial [Myxococcaceae bacterium]